MDYVSHSEYKKFLDQFQKQTKKGRLIEGVEEGNKFTKALAQTPKGGSFNMNGKSFKDKTNYDAPVKEYSFDDMYPNDPGPFETKHVNEYSDNEIEGVVREIEEILTSTEDYPTLGPGDVQAVIDHFIDDPKANIIRTVEKRAKAEEGIGPHGIAHIAIEDYLANKTNEGRIGDREDEFNMAKYRTNPVKFPKTKNTADLDYAPKSASFKPDYLTVDDEDIEDDDMPELDLDDDDQLYKQLPKNFQKHVAGDKAKLSMRESKGLSGLSQTERDQLKEYIESVKTIKQEIQKLMEKAKKGGMGEDMGGNRTGLVMTSTTTS
jgi:hypothetical protein